MTDIHPSAIVDPAAVLGEDVSIGPFCVIGAGVTLGARTKIASHVVIEGVTTLGVDNAVGPFAVLGAPPQHAAHKGEATTLVIGDRNIIREHATMHTGTAGGRGTTVVGSDGFFMVESHVAHDCVIGDHVIMTKGATLGGHVTLADYVIVGGLAAIHQYARVGRHAMVGGMAAVSKDVIPYGSVWGNHAHLEGLNLVGLKRRGFSREAISTMRAAYRMLFANEGTFQERLEDTAEAYAGAPEVMEIVNFIRDEGNRPICLPEREV
jgi:UDP-N-acetylglucosamine acyltransferase